MSKFIGQVEGMANSLATRRGGKFIKASVQSYDGSLITRMTYDDHDNLMVSLDFSDDSSFYGQCLFYGSFEELKQKLL